MSAKGRTFFRTMDEGVRAFGQSSHETSLWHRANLRYLLENERIITRMTHGVSTGFSVVSPCTNRHNLTRGNLRKSWCHNFFRDEKLSLEHSQLVVCPQTLSIFCRFTQPERTFMIVVVVYLSIYHHSLTLPFNPDREALRKPAEAGIIPDLWCCIFPNTRMRPQQ